MNSPHEDVPHANVDVQGSDKASVWSKIVRVVKDNPKKATAIVVAIIAVLSALGYAAWSQSSDEPEFQAPKRAWSDPVGQTHLPKPKIIDGAGKGTLSTIDNAQGGKRIDATMVGVDAVGGQSGATLSPPQDVSQVGYYIRSAPFGAKNKGSSVVTSHIDYNGVVGVGSVFTSLRKGDPITITDDKGTQFHYIVESRPKNISKTDGDYAAKTMDSVNRSRGKNSLVLVTCGGQFDPNSPLGYQDNIVVQAKFISSDKPAKK